MSTNRDARYILLFAILKVEAGENVEEKVLKIVREGYLLAAQYGRDMSGGPGEIITLNVGGKRCVVRLKHVVLFTCKHELYR